MHELVAGSSAWQVRAAKDKVKVGDFAVLLNLILPRVRTYHTRKPSRFVHALSACPLKVRELTDSRSERGRRRRDRVSGRGEVCALTGWSTYFLLFLLAVLGLYLVGVGASTTRDDT